MWFAEVRQSWQCDEYLDPSGSGAIENSLETLHIDSLHFGGKTGDILSIAIFFLLRKWEATCTGYVLGKIFGEQTYLTVE